MALPYQRDRETAERLIAATEARVHFGELTRDIERTGEPVFVERNGHPVVVLVRLDEYRRLQRRPSAPDPMEAIRAAQEAFRPFRARGVRLDAPALIRAGRDDEEDYRTWEPDALPGR